MRSLASARIAGSTGKYSLFCHSESSSRRFLGRAKLPVRGTRPLKAQVSSSYSANPPEDSSEWYSKEVPERGQPTTKTGRLLLDMWVTLGSSSRGGSVLTGFIPMLLTSITDYRRVRMPSRYRPGHFGL